MSGIPQNRMIRLEAVRLRVDEAMHPWHQAEAQAVDAHWAREQVERPWLFNGTVMLHRGLRHEAGVVTGISHRVPYAALLHWIKTQPRADAWHLFGSAVMISSDNAMLLIRMAARTANAGKVYAPSGSLDENDISGGCVDVESGFVREALEETGYDLARAEAEQPLWCWRFDHRVAVFRRFRLNEPAAVLVERMREHIRTDPEQEIEDMVVVRAPADAGPSVTPYMKAMIDFHFAAPDFVTGCQAGGMG
ncbi:NUDIX hydrolase [Hoeflea ulvae]